MQNGSSGGASLLYAVLELSYKLYSFFFPPLKYISVGGSAGYKGLWGGQVIYVVYNIVIVVIHLALVSEVTFQIMMLVYYWMQLFYYVMHWTLDILKGSVHLFCIE
jgi:hypothetical protein